MAGVEVQQFISSHRDKLNEEKVRFQERTPRSILPSGSQASEQTAILRKEREAEYKDFLKTQASVPKSRSISEVRKEMAQSRDRELSSHSDTNLVSDRSRAFDYGSLKERRMAEERQYRNHDYNDHRPSWRDNRPSVGFKEGHNRPPPRDKSWESEEKDLVSWARQQHTNQRPNRPPSPVPHTSTRSISAPTPPTARGIAALGGRDNDWEAKRNRQREYAESLRAQIREKAKSPEPSHKLTTYRPKSPESSRAAQHRDSYKESRRSRSPPVDHREPPSARDQHYPPYPSMYQHYPPPPPPPHHPYYMHTYYGPPPPPRDVYYPERPDPYRYPYYPSHEYSAPGSYLPPHVPNHVPNRFRDEWMETKSSRRERAGETRRSNEEKENQTKKDDVYTSPIHGDGSKTSKQNKSSYRKELEKQMKEKKARELKAKIEKEKFEQKKENEIYDPFGKGGCGAPVRDQYGNLVADLKRMKRLNDERSGASPRNSQEFAKLEDSPLRKSLDDKVTPLEKTVLIYDKLDDEAVRKNDQESYRDFLRRQVQEKEERKRKQKEAEMLEEKKEMERLEKDRLKLENERKKDRDRERLTEVELKRKNEALMKEAEVKRRELAIKQKEELHQQQLREKEFADQKMQELAEKMAQPVQQQRSGSPPIPTIRKQLNQQGDGKAQFLPPHPTSPPVPTLQKQITQVQQYPQSSQPPLVPTFHSQQTPSLPPTQAQQQVPQYEQRTVAQHTSFQNTHKTLAQLPRHQIAPNAMQGSVQQPTQPMGPYVDNRSVAPPPVSTSDGQATESTILSQLAALRMHLQGQLADQIKTGASDTQTGHHAPKHTTPAPKATAGPRVRQPHSGALAANMDKFSSLKYKSPFPNQEFLRQFPNPPRTESALEVQQGAMLRHQEERLARLKNDRKDKDNTPSGAIGGLLPSVSHGVPLSSADPFREDAHSKSEVLPANRGQMNARSTSAGRHSQFSIATLDVDGMTSRNEERMRRLDAILNAGTGDRGVRGVESGYKPGGDARNVRGVESGYEPGGGARSVKPKEDSETIISNFLNRESRGRPSITRGSERSLECETVYQRLGTPSS